MIKRTIVSIIVFFCMTYVVFSQSLTSSESTLKASPQDSIIGNLVNVTLEVTAPINALIEPDIPEDFYGFELINTKKTLTKSENEIKTEIFQYEVVSFTTGEKEIGPIKTTISIPNGETRSISSGTVKINIRSVLTPQDKDIKDISDNLKINLPLIFYLIATLVLLLLILGITALFRKLKNSKKLKYNEKIKTPEEKAQYRFEQLEKPDIFLILGRPGYYQELTDILREYIFERYDIQAPEMTTSELLKKLKPEPWFTEVYNQIKNVFVRSDKVKFSKFMPTEETASEDLKTALDIYHRIKYKGETSQEELS